MAGLRFHRVQAGEVTLGHPTGPVVLHHATVTVRSTATGTREVRLEGEVALAVWQRLETTDALQLDRCVLGPQLGGPFRQAFVHVIAQLDVSVAGAFAARSDTLESAAARVVAALRGETRVADARSWRLVAASQDGGDGVRMGVAVVGERL